MKTAVYMGKVYAFSDALAMGDKLNAIYKERCKELDAVSGTERGAMGLVPDAIRERPEWQKAKKEERLAFEAVRSFNGFFTKAFKREYAVWRDEQRKAKGVH